MRETARAGDQPSDFYEPNEARQWIFSPQKLLGGESPAELIRKGRIEEVRRLVNQLRDGVYLSSPDPPSVLPICPSLLPIHWAEPDRCRLRGHDEGG